MNCSPAKSQTTCSCRGDGQYVEIAVAISYKRREDGTKDAAHAQNRQHVEGELVAYTVDLGERVFHRVEQWYIEADSTKERHERRKRIRQLLDPREVNDARLRWWLRPHPGQCQ